MRTRSIKSTRHLFISWVLLFISYYSWEDGLNCFSNGIWISYPPPTCFVCLIKYLVLSFQIIIRQSKSKPLPSIEGNSKRRKYTNEIQNKYFRDITENMRTSFHPRQFRYHLALGTPNRKHIRNHKPPSSISVDPKVSQRDAHIKISKYHTKKVL